MLRKMLVGSVTEAVLRDTLCNVLIVPPALE
jgi:nucleotide-binding universal stress UspA family protein